MVTVIYFGRWINTSVAHNLHHEHFEGNYGLYFLVWDRRIGTIREDYTTIMSSWMISEGHNFDSMP